MFLLRYNIISAWSSKQMYECDLNMFSLFTFYILEYFFIVCLCSWSFCDSAYNLRTRKSCCWPSTIRLLSCIIIIYLPFSMAGIELFFCEYPQQQYASYLYLAMWPHPWVVPNQGWSPTTKQTCCCSCVLAHCRKTNASDKQTWPPAAIRESALSPRGNTRGRFIYINRAWHELIYIFAIFGETLLLALIPKLDFYTKCILIFFIFLFAVSKRNSALKDVSRFVKSWFHVLLKIK